MFLSHVRPPAIKSPGFPWVEGCLLPAIFQLSNLIGSQVTFLQRREWRLTWRVEVDYVFDGEVSGLSSFQTISQQTQEQEPGQGRASFHGRPRRHSSRGPGSGDLGRRKRTCTWNTKPESCQCPTRESHRDSAQLLWRRDELGRNREPRAQGSG